MFVQSRRHNRWGLPLLDLSHSAGGVRGRGRPRGGQAPPVRRSSGSRPADHGHPPGTAPPRGALGSRPFRDPSRPPTRTVRTSLLWQPTQVAALTLRRPWDGSPSRRNGSNVLACCAVMLRPIMRTSWSSGTCCGRQKMSRHSVVSPRGGRRPALGPSAGSRPRVGPALKALTSVPEARQLQPRARGDRDRRFPQLPGPRSCTPTPMSGSIREAAAGEEDRRSAGESHYCRRVRDPCASDRT